MTNLEIATSFFAAYTAHNVAAMLRLFAENAHFHYVPMGEQGTGAVGQMAPAIWQRYMDAFPDFTSKMIRQYTTTDGNVVVEALNSGTQAKEVDGIQSKGRQMAAPHLFIFEFAPAGLIQKITAYWDSDTIFRQLGPY